MSEVVSVGMQTSTGGFFEFICVASLCCLQSHDLQFHLLNDKFNQMDNQETTIQLADLANAAKTPKVPAWWSLACWILFFAGATVMLLALAALGYLAKNKLSQETDIKPALSFAIPMAGAVFFILPFAFTMAAINTFCAATGFEKRKQEIFSWIQSEMNRRSGIKQVQKRNDRIDRHPDHGLMHVRGNLSSRTHDDSLEIMTSGLYSPGEYQAITAHESHLFPLAVYLDLLRAETHGARTTCAKMAAALGGLFITGIQIYSRLLQLINS